MPPKVVVLKVGHRPERDKRVDTHLALVARAFGAVGVVFDEKDPSLEKKIEDVVARWGGPFWIETGVDPEFFVDKWLESGGEVIHLTQYGLPLNTCLQEIRSSPRDKLVVVGGPKVPRWLFEKSSWNVSITTQPHSEVAACAIFLHMLFGGDEFNMVFEDAMLKVIPQARGKKVVKLR